MMKANKHLGKIALTWAAAGFALTAIVSSGMRADAQAIASSTGGLYRNFGVGNGIPVGSFA